MIGHHLGVLPFGDIASCEDVAGRGGASIARMTILKPTELAFDGTEFHGHWERNDPMAEFFLRSVHVLQTRQINDFETEVSVVDARAVEIPDVVVSREDVERIFFWLTLDLARLARQDRAGFWREKSELEKLLRDTASYLFSRGEFERAKGVRQMKSAWKVGSGEGPRSVRDFPSGLPGLGKRR